MQEWHVALRTRPGLGHVLAFGFDGGSGVWIVVDPMRHGTVVTVLPPWEFDAWVLEISLEFEIYRIARRAETAVWFPGLWCVGAVKRLVGLRSSALSPAGLRRDLLGAGARRVFSREGSEDGHQGRPGGDGRP